MILLKGTYRFIKVGLGNACILNKEKNIPIYADDAVTMIGQAMIIEENPLELVIEISEDLEFESSYFSIVPMNYTQQNGYIINIDSFKLVTSYLDYKPFILSETDLVKAEA